MKHMAQLTTTLIIAVLALASPATADVPQMLNYQGHLTDASGVFLDTTVSITFTIYDDSTGGAVIWTETHPAVTVDSGMFNVILGTFNAAHDTICHWPERWLGITVGSDPELSPRTRLVSAPYAFRAASVPGFSPGPNNIDSGMYVFVAGDSNIAIGDYTTIAGGYGNYVEGVNFADSIPDTCAGAGLSIPGSEEFTYGPHYIGGPCYYPPYDPLDPPPSPVTLGGKNNSATGWGSGIAWGASNIASWGYSAVVGGCSNDALGDFSFICGGRENTAGCASSSHRGGYSFVGGGQFNLALGYGTTICGGRLNTAGICPD